jgi:hypothetical protein
MNTEQLKALLSSYGRSVLASGLALYMAGVTDPKDLWTALVAAIAPVAIRALNPNDKAFGILPDAKAVDKALKAAKAPVKKTANPKVATRASKKTSGGGKTNQVK